MEKDWDFCHNAVVQRKQKTINLHNMLLAIARSFPDSYDSYDIDEHTLKTVCRTIKGILVSYD